MASWSAQTVPVGQSSEERQPCHRWLVLVVRSHEPSPQVHDEGAVQLMTMGSFEFPPVLPGEVMQHTLEVSVQEDVDPQRKVGATQFPALSQDRRMSLNPG